MQSVLGPLGQCRQSLRPGTAVVDMARDTGPEVGCLSGHGVHVREWGRRLERRVEVGGMGVAGRVVGIAESGVEGRGR